MSFIHNKMAFPCARSTSSSCTIFIFVCEVAFFFIYDRSGGHLISLKWNSNVALHSQIQHKKNKIVFEFGIWCVRPTVARKGSVPQTEMGLSLTIYGRLFGMPVHIYWVFIMTDSRNGNKKKTQNAVCDPPSWMGMFEEPCRAPEPLQLNSPNVMVCHDLSHNSCEKPKRIAQFLLCTFFFGDCECMCCGSRVYAGGKLSFEIHRDGVQCIYDTYIYSVRHLLTCPICVPFLFVFFPLLFLLAMPHAASLFAGGAQPMCRLKPRIEGNGNNRRGKKDKNKKLPQTLFATVTVIVVCMCLFLPLRQYTIGRENAEHSWRGASQYSV